MEEVRNHHVLVPHAGGTAVLVAGGSDGPRLPCARGRPGAAGVLEALRGAFRLDSPYLRPVQRLTGPDGKPFASLHELDAPSAEWELAEGLFWMPLDEADPAALAEAPFERSIASWLEHASGSSVPESRPPWARPGWLASATGWIRRSCEALELEPRDDVEMVEQWPISSVLRLDTSGGRVYFKAAFSIFVHEPAVTSALAARHPELVTQVLAVDEARGWLLMRALPGAEIGDLDSSRWADGLRAMATIHRAWAGREPELRALGAVDRSLATLDRELPDVLASVELESELRTRLDAVSPSLARLPEMLASGPLSETLIHGDLHPWNVMADGAEVRIFDWSDACVAHPLFDLTTYLRHVDDLEARSPMRDAYLGTWGDLASLPELRELAALAGPLAYVHHAQSYLRILEAMEPDDRWYFEHVPRAFVLDAVEQLEASSAV